MQKVFIEFQFVVNEKEYRVLCEPNSPYKDCKDVGNLFIDVITKMEEAQKAQMEAHKAVEEENKQPVES